MSESGGVLEMATFPLDDPKSLKRDPSFIPVYSTSPAASL